MTAAARWFKRRSPFVGQVDHVSHRVVRGWVWQPNDPKRRVRLDVLYRDIFLGQVSAAMYRQDLQSLGFGDGHQGFTFHFPDDVPEGNIDLTALCIASAGPERWTLPFSSDLIGGDTNVRRLRNGHRQAFRPFLKMLGDAPPRDRETSAGRRVRIELLCAGRPRPRRQCVRRAYRPANTRAPNLVSGDPDSFWRWYLGSYARERGPALAPLACHDIERLTQPRSDRGSVAADLLLAPNAAAPGYEWALEADRLFLSDCLVLEQDAEALRAIGTTRSSYPLSIFMRLARAEMAYLRALPIATEHQRKRLYVLFMILGLRNPAVLSYLPTPWLRRLLDQAKEFEAILSRLFGADVVISGGYAARVRTSGYDLASQTFRGHRYQDHRVRGGPSVLTTTAQVDVQIFGPFRRKMGLGESCRRVAAALQETPFSINFVEYDVGTSTAFLDQDKNLKEARSARLNILHLNAEEIPEALAYLPDVFSQTPTVAMPYWELNRPSRAHRLGLRTVDEIWVASRFLTEVYSESGKPVRWVGMCCAEAPAPDRGSARRAPPAPRARSRVLRLSYDVRRPVLGPA